MSKNRKKIDNDPRQLSIFDFLKSENFHCNPSSLPHKTNSGDLAVTERLRESLRVSLKLSPLSRHQIAGEISHLVGETITKEIIDSWTRQSDEINGRPGRHIPAEYLPAFCQATGDHTPIKILGELVGLFVLPGPEALRAEIQRLNEEATRIATEKRKRKMFLQEMER